MIPALPNQNGQANVPGFRKLWLIETRYILGMVDPRTIAGALADGWMLTATGLQIAEDAVIQAFKFPADRGEYSQKASVTIHGVSYAHSLSLMVPKDHPLVALVVQRMSGRKFVAVYQDANGLMKLVGSPKQPLRFLAEMKTSPNGYAFSWTTQTRHPAIFFTDPDLFLTDRDGGPAEFSFGFSYDFYS
ncbi:hypothetical protein HMF3257_00610 [Spirosoma telluris]|uniref:Uncharacterized protein n=1 Tax=Spirosoma telluris TaxID=2183553 RepID=A0A327NH90_9BACT|nr:hypothetical protein HMF3257_00610 [Spirosoma telluris]